MLEHAWVRFAISGTLIGVYAIADHLARRHAHGSGSTRSPRWPRPLQIVTITAFYLLIRPTGGPLWGGLGNLAGLAVVTLAIVVRANSWVRYPALAGHAVFHTGLPIAVGVPWGLLVLGLPACVATALAWRREERVRRSAAPVAEATTRRVLLPGLW
jgi:protein-S-isoprenylcysteine O-methyltransferase Ste14